MGSNDADGTFLYRDNATTGAETDYIAMGAHTVDRFDEAGSFTWTHADQLGSANAATNAAGAVIWEERYTPYGELMINAAQNEDEAGFTGHIRDAATGLTYAQARFYNPVTARFLAPDPVGFADMGPGYFQRYAYVGNDPVNATDPTGMCEVDTSGKQIGLCPASGAAAGNLVDEKLSNPNSIGSAVEALAVDAGVRIEVRTDGSRTTTDSGFHAPDPDSRSAPDGEINIGLQPDTVIGKISDGPEQAIDFSASDAMEHELSHAMDHFTGRSDQNAVGRIEVSGRLVSVSRNGRNAGREEARAINRTNRFRAREGRSDRRTGY